MADAAIQSMIFVAGITGATHLFVDWSTGLVCIQSGGNTFVQFADSLTGVVGTRSPASDLTGQGGTQIQMFSGGGATSDSNGHGFFAFVTSSAPRFSKLSKWNEALNPTGSENIWNYGTENAGGPPGTPSIGDPLSMSFTKASFGWIVSTNATFTATPDIESFSDIDGTFLGKFTMTEGYGVGAPGSKIDGQSIATAYVVTQPATILHDQIGFYAAFIDDTSGPSSATFTAHKIGVLEPGDIDPDWAGLNYANSWGPLVDLADNGVIFQAKLANQPNWASGTTYATGDRARSGTSNYISLQDGNIGHSPATSPTFWRPIQSTYLIKVNTGPFNKSLSGSFGIAWQIPIKIFGGDASNSDSFYFGLSQVISSKYCYLETSVTGFTTAYLINTTTGEYNTVTLNGVSGIADQAWDSESLSVVCKVSSYVATVAGHPTNLNGTTSFTGNWARIYPGGEFPAPPPPPPALRAGYIIERFDNRVWPTVEDCWCVDCGFTLARPEPAADLEIDSATGAGALLGITDLVGGSGYSDSTTVQVVDDNGLGPGTGAVAALTIVGGVITAISFAVAGSGYLYPQLVFNDPENTGSGASATVLLDNSVALVASAAVFTSDDVGSVVRAGYGVAAITEFIDSTHVTATIISPVAQVKTDNPLHPNTPITFVSGTWTMTKPISQLYLPQLIGFEITGLADGQIIPLTLVPDSGIVTLATPASAIIVGLPFEAQLQSTYLDAGEPTVQGQRKKVAEVTVRIEQSAAFQIGANQPDGSVQSPQELAPLWQNMVDAPTHAVAPFNSPALPLFTGDVRIPVPSGFNTRGQVAVQQLNPLPLQVLDYVPEVLSGDKPAQEAPPRKQQKNGGQ